MADKKKDSPWMEPYNILKLLGSAFLLVGAAIKSGFNYILSDKNSTSDTSDEEKIRYAVIQEELQEKSAIGAWHRFLLTGMLIQTFLTVFTIAHFVEGNWFIGVELLLMTFTSIVLFGYKPWIIRNKRYVSFAKYLRVVKTDLKALALWYSYNGVK